MSDARRFADLVNRSGRGLIRNLQTTLRVERLGGLEVPVSVNDGERTGYLCSPSAAFIDYAASETRHFTANPVLRGALVALAQAGRPLLRLAGWDRQAQINNWLVSTNPTAGLTGPAVLHLARRLARELPRHAVVLRSLNERWDADLLAELRAGGFRLVPMRQVYLMPEGWRPATRDARKDRRLLERTGLERVPGSAFRPDDFRRAAELYAMLYLGKYTTLNPDYSDLFLREMAGAGLLDLVGFREPGGPLVGVAGRLVRGGRMVCPILGYDTGRPAREGLYRLLSAEVSRQAEAEGLRFNRSAGAGAFKRARGMEPAIEYLAVLDRHLPRRARAAGWLVERLMRAVAVPLVRRYGL